VNQDQDVVAGWVDAPPAEPRLATLAPEHRLHVSFVLEVVDLLAARYGFDPATLVSPRTGAPLGPELTRMRQALAASADLAGERRTSSSARSADSPR
jgi:hypothetical protein